MGLVPLLVIADKVASLPTQNIPLGLPVCVDPTPGSIAICISNE